MLSPVAYLDYHTRTCQVFGSMQEYLLLETDRKSSDEACDSSTTSVHRKTKLLRENISVS
jgi:hypothetical protein